MTLVERHRDGLPLPSAGAIVRSTQPLVVRTNHDTPLTSSSVTKQACGEAWIANSDRLVPPVYHATQPLPPMTACSSNARNPSFVGF
jgi:hypothetical protein